MEKEIDNLIITPPESIEESASRAYTDWLRSVETNIPDELKQITSKSSVEYFFSKLKQKYEQQKYDSVLDIKNRLIQTLIKTVPSFNDKYGKDYENGIGIFHTDIKSLPQKEQEETVNKILHFLTAAINNVPDLNHYDLVFLKYIFAQYTRFKSSSDYITRLVEERLKEINPELLIGNPSTGLLILRQFISQFSCGKAEDPETHKKSAIENYSKGNGYKNTNSYYSQSIEHLCEKKYDGDYQRMARELTESEYQELCTDELCNFAKIAQNLSTSFFSCQKKTREYLYIFAIAFEMELHLTPEQNSESSQDSDSSRDWTDIQKNLFFDYYTDNLVNQVTDTKLEEKTIDGYGINWRNFTEVCYLYYISKTDFSPALKLKKVLKACYHGKDSIIRDDKGRVIAPNKAVPGTIAAREMVINELFKLSEDDFFDYAYTRFNTKKGARDDGSTAAAGVARNAERFTSDAFCRLLAQAADKNESNLPDDLTKINNWILEIPSGKSPLCFSDDFKECINRFANRIKDADPSREDGYTGRTRTCLLAAYSSCIASLYMNCNIADASFTARLSTFHAFYDYFTKKAEFILEEIENEKGVFYNIYSGTDKSKFNPKDNDELLNGAKNALSELMHYGEKSAVTERTFYGVNDFLIPSGYQEIYCGNLFDLLIIYQTFRRCCMIWDCRLNNKT